MPLRNRWFLINHEADEAVRPSTLSNARRATLLSMAPPAAKEVVECFGSPGSNFGGILNPKPETLNPKP